MLPRPLLRPVVGVLLLLGALAAAACTDGEAERDPQSLLQDVEGYRLVRLSPTVERSIQHNYQVNPELDEGVTEVYIRNVQPEDNPEVSVGLAMVLVVPEAAAEEGFDRRVAQGFMEDQGSPPREIDLAGRTVFEGTPAPVMAGSHLVSWVEGDLVVAVIGNDPERTRDIAEAMLRP